MRVLYSTRPFLGHLYPFVPLGRELSRRGHAAAVASGPQLISAVEDAGMTWLPAGIHPSDVTARFGGVDSDYGVEPIRAKVMDLLEILTTWYRPDLVIREPTDLAAALAVEIVGTPCVTLGVGHYIPTSSWQFLAAESLRTLREEFQLPPDPNVDFLSRGLYLDVVPPSWQLFEGRPPEGLWRVGYRVWDGPDEQPVPPEIADLDPDATNVLVTLGTVYNHDRDLLDTILAGFADADDVTVVCTIGEGELPTVAMKNLRAFRYVPHSAVLPHCNAVVCHGGFNTVMGALAFGVPVVCVPMGADQFYNADRCEERGVGLALDRDELTAENVAEAVRSVLTDGAYSTAARRIRQEMQRQPAPAAVRVVLEQMLSLRGERRSAW